ncbi:MAG TPA: SOS response-associated peptidase [Burkholderiales bacterium]|nr:SOS response-associated peptidase [Burkholderiales bacterium]
MCGRYALHASPEVIALQFGLAEPPALQPSYNICPGTELLVVRAERDGRRSAEPRRWGLVPAWAKDPAIGHKLANARGETVAEKPAFRSAFRFSRCLVPASGFYEWKTVAGRKLPYYIRPADEQLFALAGLCERWQGPQGELRTVSLITTEPNALMADIHDRMPVLVPPERYAEWLDPHNRDGARLQAFLAPYPPERMRAHPVSTRVNRPQHDDAALIEPV